MTAPQPASPGLPRDAPSTMSSHSPTGASAMALRVLVVCRFGGLVVKDAVAAGTEVEPLVFADLVRQLWRDVHVAPLADPVGHADDRHAAARAEDHLVAPAEIAVQRRRDRLPAAREIGRASCRERV